MGNSIPRSRVLFSDMILDNRKELYDNGAESLTEVKFENTINRLTAVANPRQIERVIRGSRFELDIIYEVVKEEEVLDDFRLLAEGFRLLEYDYIGGHGSRGYGKVKFRGLKAASVVGNLPEEMIGTCNSILGEAGK